MPRSNKPLMSYFLGVLANRQRPTLKHRPAIWENMLGTVYAMDDDGEVRYFDYDHDLAKAWAGLFDGLDRDFRVAKAPSGRQLLEGMRAGQRVLYVLKQDVVRCGLCGEKFHGPSTGSQERGEFVAEMVVTNSDGKPIQGAPVERVPIIAHAQCGIDNGLEIG